MLIKKYSTQELLKVIGNFNKGMFDKKESMFYREFTVTHNRYTQEYHQYICPWDLNDIAYMSIKYSNDYRENNIKEQDLYSIVNEYKRISDKESEKVNSIEDRDKLIYILYPLSQKQFWYQQRFDMIENFNRNMHLLTHTSIKVKSDIDIDEIVNNELGLNTNEYINSLVLILIGSINFVDITDFIISNEEIFAKFKLDRSKVSKVLEQYTATYDEVRKSSLKENITFIKPIIKTQKGRLIVYNQWLMIRLLSEGMYWVIRNYYFKKGSQKFTNEFGKYFEEYVAELFKTCLMEEQYRRIQESKIKMADWIIETDEFFIILEQKSTIASLMLRRENPDLDNLKKYIEKYEEAFNQLNSTERNIDTKNKKVLKFIVHYDLLYSTEMIEDYLYQKRAISDDKNISFLGIRELEILVYLLSRNKEVFDEVLNEKFKREQEKSRDGRNLEIILRMYGIKENRYIKENINYLDNIMSEFQMLTKDK